jgi:hypothetical protein
VTATRERPERRAGFLDTGRLAVYLPSEGDDRVDAEDQLAIGELVLGDRSRLAVGVLGHDLVWRSRAELLDVSDPDLERNPELLEDRPPLRGA